MCGYNADLPIFWIECLMSDLPPHILAAETAEKKAIRDYFGNKRHGVFIEVGANEPTAPESQSHHLETLLEWNGLLVEPIPYLAAEARRSRPNSIVCQNACTSPAKTGGLELLLPRRNGEVVTGHASLEANIDEHNYSDFEKIRVDAVTLESLCRAHGIHQVDLLSIDVEGAELDVLEGADLGTLKPQLILLEDKHLYLSKHRFLVRAGYRLAQRANRNCWYVRADAPMPAVRLGSKLRLWKRMYVSIWFKKLVYAFRHGTLKPFRTL